MTLIAVNQTNLVKLSQGGRINASFIRLLGKLTQCGNPDVSGQSMTIKRQK
jgi:hypothetical protein